MKEQIQLHIKMIDRCSSFFQSFAENFYLYESKFFFYYFISSINLLRSVPYCSAKMYKFVPVIKLAVYSTMKWNSNYFYFFINKVLHSLLRKENDCLPCKKNETHISFKEKNVNNWIELHISKYERRERQQEIVIVSKYIRKGIPLTAIR